MSGKKKKVTATTEEVAKNAYEAEIIDAKEMKQDSCSEDNVTERDVLLAKIEKNKEEIKSLTEEAARARADYYNFRTRVERDRERDRKFAAEKSIDLLLPVYENLERICEAIEDPENSLYKGAFMVSKQFAEAMAALGLEPISTDCKFDPAVHEAVSMEEVDDESKDGYIIGALRKGYKLAGRVIRAPQVKVGKYTKK